MTVNRLKLAPTDDEADASKFASAADEAEWREADRIGRQRSSDAEMEANAAAIDAALAEDLAKEMPAQTAILSGRAALDKSIAEDRSEEARILAIIAEHSARHRQVKTSRRAKEDMRDSMAAAES